MVLIEVAEVRPQPTLRHRPNSVGNVQVTCRSTTNRGGRQFLDPSNP
jgi:hypothetical protein